MSYKHPHHRAPAREYPELNYTAGDKWIKSLTKDRIGKFHGGRYSDINLSSVLFTHRIYNSEHVKLQVWSAPGLEKPTFEEAMKQKFKPAKKTNHWWKVTIIIPTYWEQYERVQCVFLTSYRSHTYIVPPLSRIRPRLRSHDLQYGRNTAPRSAPSPHDDPMNHELNKISCVIGITGGYGGDRRVEYIIPLSARKEAQHNFVIESSCNGMFGVPLTGDTIDPPDVIANPSCFN
ncbi:hypothetical protein C0989_007559 [Termitomyces sp. Mn162]|nr:hypothetical protein C0989_007559 [Termitomyces sp. Mn162]